MKILLTGGAGYIGSHIALDLIEKGNEVVILDDLSDSNELIIENLKELTDKKFTFYAYNCINEHLIDKVFDDHKFELIIHNANKNPHSKINPIETYNNNINSLLIITKLMLKHEVNNLIFTSSALVYGEQKSDAIAESTNKKNASTPYGVSMQICENILLSLEDEINTVVLRQFNPIGNHKSGLLGSTNIGLLGSLYKSYKNKKQFQIFGDNYNTNDGTAIRDYIHVNDVIKIYFKAIGWLIDSKKSDQFNVSTGVGYSVKQMILFFENAFDYKMSVVSGARKRGDTDKIIGGTEKIKKLLGFVPKIDVTKVIKESIKWSEYYLNQITDDTKNN